MRMSYAQNLEDYHLDLVFPDGPGVYVDVGAGHPVADNVSFWFYLRGWHGLVVEPQQQLAAAYAGVRPRDRVVGCLAGSREGEADFHEVEGLHGLSSMVVANAERAREMAGVRTVRKRIVPLSRLIDEAGLGARVDFLKIDVEGAEAEVLAGLDLARHRPAVIVVESLNPANMTADASAFEPALIAARYRPALFDGLNRFYVAEERPELAARLPDQPAPWDRVAHLWDCGRALHSPAHPDRRLAEVLAAGLCASLPGLGQDLIAELVVRGLAALGTPCDGASREALVGTAEFPGAAVPPPPEPADLADLVGSDRFRAALGRIASMYDGGHIVDPVPPDE